MLCIAVMIMLAVMMIQSVHTYSVSKAACRCCSNHEQSGHPPVPALRRNWYDTWTIAGNPSVQSSFIREEGSEVD